MRSDEDQVMTHGGQPFDDAGADALGRIVVAGERLAPEPVITLRTVKAEQGIRCAAACVG